MSFSSTELVKLLLASNAIFFAGFLIHKRSVWPLILLVLLFGVQMSLQVLALDQTFVSVLNTGCAFSYGPTLLALVKKLAWQKNSATSWWHWSAPGCLPLLLFLFPSLLPGMWPLVSLSLLGYFVLILWDLSLFHRALEQNYSNVSEKNLQWLKKILFSFAGLALIDASRMLLRLHDAVWRLQLDQILSFINSVAALALLYWLIWRSMQQQLLFDGIDDAQLAVSQLNAADAPGAAEQSSPDRQDRECSESIKALQACMEIDQAFLQPDLSVQQLATMLQWHPKKLSILINTHYQKNFSDFVNQYRVQFACQLLRQADRQNVKLISIQLDSGFASKSVFNAQFKKVTGMSPTEYRRFIELERDSKQSESSPEKNVS